VWTSCNPEKKDLLWVEGFTEEKAMLQDLLHNEILICGAIGWLSAQVLKTIVHAIVNKGIDWSRLLGDGGMPSGHSATVTSMAVRAGIIYGMSSFQFAITAMLAIIVMHDAMGVRLETGKQSKVIKELAAILETMGKDVSDEEKLKEFVGHTPAQVVAGAILGIVVAVLV
jgi:acid phosphatase family membrane protein YuiD